jgi:hypothetical protein
MRPSLIMLLIGLSACASLSARPDLVVASGVFNLEAQL